MNIKVDNNISITVLEELFVKCFSELKGNDGQGFDESTDQEFKDWFGIEYLQDYLKYSHVIIAEEDGNILGGALVGMQNPLSWPDGRKYELFILGVLPEYRKRGVGKMIMEVVEKVSRDNGALSIILNTHELMTGTQKFYTDLGYIKIGTLNKYYGNGRAVFLMKSLRQILYEI